MQQGDTNQKKKKNRFKKRKTVKMQLQNNQKEKQLPRPSTIQTCFIPVKNAIKTFKYTTLAEPPPMRHGCTTRLLHSITNRQH